jgi:hypothetical protein
MSPSGCVKRMSLSEAPNGFFLTILDHQSLGDELPYTLFRMELFVLGTVVKLYTGTA